MDLHSLEKLLATSRRYFSLPMSDLAKPESPPPRGNQAPKQNRSAKASSRLPHQRSSIPSSLY